MQECLQLMFITTFSFKNRKDHFNAPFPSKDTISGLGHPLCAQEKSLAFVSNWPS